MSLSLGFVKAGFGSAPAVNYHDELRYDYPYRYCSSTYYGTTVVNSVVYSSQAVLGGSPRCPETMYPVYCDASMPPGRPPPRQSR